MTVETSTSRFPITVIILTYNEAVTIGACLSHVMWADDVVLVDSHSTDRTIDVARSALPGIRVFEHRFTDFGAQRNWAIDNSSPRHEWILFLDADEHCNPECSAAIQKAVMNPGGNAGFYLTCRNMFLGRWIRHCTLYPSWQLRLLRRGEVRFRREGHGQREVTEGPLGYITAPYDHYGFAHGIEHWIARHNRYSTNEVELIHRLRREPLALRELFTRDPIARRRCLKRLAARVGCRPAARFVYLYFIRLGFLDGRAGWQFCQLRVAHEIHIAAKLAEAEISSKQGTTTADDMARHPASSERSTGRPASEFAPDRVS